jgi:8-oxo-dGTP pyrophosphatase MutT (NUDIX family)
VTADERSPGRHGRGALDVPDLSGLRIRRAVRAAVVDPDDRVMLVRFEFPTVTVWATPGGGQEEGEDDEATLRRELDEELGLHVAEIGPHIWTRTHVIPFIDGLWDGQRDHVYLVRTPAFVPAPALTWEQLAAERVHELRWWTAPELARAERDGVRFAPRRLPELVATLVREGAPAAPIDVGV